MTVTDGSHRAAEFRAEVVQPTGRPPLSQLAGRLGNPFEVTARLTAVNAVRLLFRVHRINFEPLVKRTITLRAALMCSRRGWPGLVVPTTTCPLH